MYTELLKRLITIHAILFEKEKTTALTIKIQLTEFNEGCLQGYAEDLDDTQVEKIRELLFDIQAKLEQRGIDSVMVDDSIGIFENAINDNSRRALSDE